LNKSGNPEINRTQCLYLTVNLCEVCPKKYDFTVRNSSESGKPGNPDAQEKRFKFLMFLKVRKSGFFQNTLLFLSKSLSSGKPGMTFKKHIKNDNKNRVFRVSGFFFNQAQNGTPGPTKKILTWIW
jgi:hypothetical protein